MKKITYLLSLCLMCILGATTANAQDWWRTRATSFKADAYYLIFNAHDGRYQYLYDNNGNLGSTHTKPSEFSVDNLTPAYFFKLEVQDADANTYFIKSFNGKYVNLDGNTTNDAGYTFTLTPFEGGYGSGDDFYNALAEADDAVINNADITVDDHLFRVQNGLDGWGWNATGGTTFGTWSVCHPFAFYEIPETVIDELLATVHHDALVAAIDDYNTKLTADGGLFNPYMYTDENYQRAKDAVADAQAVIDANSDEATCQTALETLHAAIAAIPMGSGTFTIVSSYTGFETKTGTKKAIYAKENNYNWQTLNNDDLNFYWTVTAVDYNKVKIQNVATGTYMSGMGTLGTTAANVTLSHQGGGEYNLNCGGGNIHANNHGSGGGYGSNIVSYGSGANNATAWTFVSATPSEKLIDDYAANAAHKTFMTSDEGKDLQAEYNASQAYWALTLMNDAIITDAAMLSTNAQDSGEGPIADLIDDDKTTHFHSDYPNDAIHPYHYIQVNLNGTPAGDFVFYTHQRNGSNRPTSIIVYGSTDGTNFEYIKTVEPNNSTAEFISEVIAGGAYTHLRFTVNATNGGTHFFTYGAFNIIRVPSEDNLSKAIINAVDVVRTATTSADVATFEEKLLPIEDILNPVLAKPLYVGKRVTTLEEGKQYFIFNTTFVPSLGQNRSGFIQSSGSGLTLNTVLPSEFSLKRENDLNYIWTVENVGEGTYHLVAHNGKYVGADGSHNTTNVVAIAEYSAFTGEKVGIDVVSMLEDEVTTVAAPSIVSENKVWAISNEAFNNCWNGNVGSWGRWNSAHPYAFYEAHEAMDITMSAATDGVNGEDAANVQTIATFSATHPTVVPEGVTAYYATEDPVSNVLSLVAVEGAIPANQGVILTGNDAALTGIALLPANKHAVADLSGNKLANSADAAKTLSAANGDYVLTSVGGVIAFYPSNGTLAQNKAYLNLSGSSAPAFTLNFGGETTGIEGVEAENGTQVIFDLSGRRVQKAQKGLYIINGKKVLVK